MSTDKIKRLAELFVNLQEETVPIEGHEDPGVIEDYWEESRQIINELYEDSKTGIEHIEKVFWYWIVNNDCSKEKRESIRKMHDEKYHGTLGKYLFFSKNREELIQLAEKLLVKYNLHHAKTPAFLSPEYSKYVLCVYDLAPELVEEMEQYATDTIVYRKWKSDEATIKGVEQNEL